MRRGPILIGMASLKGGVGKTTSAVHIAEQGRKVLLADGDRIRTATTWAARGHLPFTVGSERSLARAAEYDVVIIDSRGGPETVELVELAQACHQLVLPVQADIPSIDGAQQTVNVLREHGVRDEQFVVMLTRVKKQRVGEGREALSSLSMPLLSGLDALRQNQPIDEDGERPVQEQAQPQPAAAKPRAPRKAPAKAAAAQKPTPAPARPAGGVTLPAWDGGTSSRSGGKNPNLGPRVRPELMAALDQLVYGLKQQGWPVDHHHVVELLLEPLLDQ